MAWQAAVITWVVIAGEGLAAILAIAQPGPLNRWIYFGLVSLAIQWIVLLTLGGMYLLRGRLGGVRPLPMACLALALLLLSSWLVYFSATVLPGNPWSGASGNAAFLRVTGIALCVGLLGLGAFYNHWRATQLALRAKQSELESLQARIRPHFLFNTLNTGAALVRQRPEEAERLLLDLADLFRAALAGPRSIALDGELALARRYLEIEGLRFGDRLRVEWRVPADVPDVAVPTLSIQPLVENAIRHGVEPSTGGGEISIAVEQRGDWVLVVVGNTIPADPPRRTTGHRVGLASVRARVHAMTGGLGTIETGATEDRHTTILRLPAARPAMPSPGGPDEIQATTR